MLTNNICLHHNNGVWSGEMSSRVQMNICWIKESLQCYPEVVSGLLPFRVVKSRMLKVPIVYEYYFLTEIYWYYLVNIAADWMVPFNAEHAYCLFWFLYRCSWAKLSFSNPQKLAQKQNSTNSLNCMQAGIQTPRFHGISIQVWGLWSRANTCGSLRTKRLGLQVKRWTYRVLSMASFDLPPRGMGRYRSSSSVVRNVGWNCHVYAL